MHHAWWSYDNDKTPTPRTQENPEILRETELIDSYVWVFTTTLLCSIFLPVLVKAIPCIGKDLGMCTVAYASLMVDYNKTATPQRRENPDFSRETEPFDSYVWVSTTTLLCSIFLPVLVKAIPCINRDLGMSVECSICITHGGVTTRRLHLEDERIPTFRGK